MGPFTGGHVPTTNSIPVREEEEGHQEAASLSQVTGGPDGRTSCKHSASGLGDCLRGASPSRGDRQAFCEVFA